MTYIPWTPSDSLTKLARTCRVMGIAGSAAMDVDCLADVHASPTILKIQMEWMREKLLV